MSEITMQEALRAVQLGGHSESQYTYNDVADYIDDLEEQLTEAQQKIAALQLQRMQTKFQHGLQQAKLLSKIPLLERPLTDAEYRRQVGMDMINAERNGDVYEP